MTLIIMRYKLFRVKTEKTACLKLFAIHNDVMLDCG